jgi:hypothetical protein
LPWGWAPLRPPPEALRTYVGCVAGAVEVVSALEVLAADVVSDVSGSWFSVVVSSDTVVVVVASSVDVVVSDKAIVEVARMVLIAASSEA